MSILDRIKAKMKPTDEPSEAPEVTNDGATVTTLAPEAKQETTPEFHMPFTKGEYIPLKGMVLRVDDVNTNDKTITLKVVGITNARAKKLGLA